MSQIGQLLQKFFTVARFRTPMSLSFFCRWSFLGGIWENCRLPRYLPLFYIDISTLNLNVHRNLYNKSKSVPAILPKQFEDSLLKKTIDKKKRKKDKLIGVRKRAFFCRFYLAVTDTWISKSIYSQKISLVRCI